MSHGERSENQLTVSRPVIISHPCGVMPPGGFAYVTANPWGGGSDPCGPRT